jgi:hypothetical protein
MEPMHSFFSHGSLSPFLFWVDVETPVVTTCAGTIPCCAVGFTTTAVATAVGTAVAVGIAVTVGVAVAVGIAVAVAVAMNPIHGTY